MISIKKISLYELSGLIKLAYEDDKEVMEKYHVQPDMKLMECVDSTFEMVKDSSKICKLTYYKILSGDKPVGFFITTYKRLYSFGIAIKFRNKRALMEWWRLVKGILGKEFLCSLYKNNTRAISFLEKQGMQIAEENEKDNSVTLINS